MFPKYTQIAPLGGLGEEGERVDGEDGHKHSIINVQILYLQERQQSETCGNSRRIYCISMGLWNWLLPACKNQLLNFQEFCELFHIMLVA